MQGPQPLRDLCAPHAGSHAADEQRNLESQVSYIYVPPAGGSSPGQDREPAAVFDVPAGQAAQAGLGAAARPPALSCPWSHLRHVVPLPLVPYPGVQTVVGECWSVKAGVTGGCAQSVVTQAVGLLALQQLRRSRCSPVHMPAL